MSTKINVLHSRCILSSRPAPDYAIPLSQIVSFRIWWWVSNTVGNHMTRQKAGTDRSLFEAVRSLTFKEAAISIQG